VSIDGRTTIDVALKPTVFSGNQLVVIGYGTQKQMDITGSQSTVSTEKLKQSQDVSTSIEGLLKGNVAGLRVIQNSAEPGGGSTIDIRGSGSINAGSKPLFVIDGLPITNSSAVSGNGAGITESTTPQNPLNNINPANIKSIEVLKDASATAIYGSRGANGVILITTKHGRNGALHVNYNGVFGLQKPANRLNLLNAQQYHDVLNQIISKGGGVDEIPKVTHSTNWQKALERKSALYTKHNLSFTGGSDKTTYFASLNYMNQKGIIINSGLERYGARLNLGSRISDVFNVGLNFSTSYTNSDIVPHGKTMNEQAGAFNTAYNYAPTWPAKNSKGKFTKAPYLDIDNPLALANGIYINEGEHRTYGTAFANYDILPILSIKGTIGTDVLNQQIRSYNSRMTKKGLANGGIATDNGGTNSNYLLQATMHYKQNFQNNNIKALLGITYQRFVSKSQRLTGKGFPSDQTKAFNLGLGDPNLSSVNSGYQNHKLLSYIGRINYVFKDKYLLTGTLRVDGSSRFGSNNRFGYFPSAAIGWRIANEEFMKNINSISHMKIRASWGQTGNQAISNYAAITSYSGSGNGVLDEKPVPTIAPQRLANSNLQWEVSTQWDIGLDFGFLKNRVSGNFDYYQKITSNMLVNVPVPWSTGFSTQLQNVGKMKNKGLELTFNSTNITTRNLQWNSSITLATLHNKVETLGVKKRILAGNLQFTSPFELIQPGYPLRSFYGYKIIGVWQKGDDFSKIKDNVQPGDFKYKDINGDGRINGADRVVLGNSFPEFTWSFDNTFSYKNISLFVSFLGERGVSMFNVNLGATYYPIGIKRNRYAKPLLNRWTPQDPSNKYPSFINTNSEGRNNVNSYTVESAAYTRLKTLRLTYHFSEGLINNVLSNASIFITGQNIFTITKYNGLNPASNTLGGSNIKVDYNAYPLARKIIVGVNLKF
jgi:TonB-linked SusC/RagA family outer membrane protein